MKRLYMKEMNSPVGVLRIVCDDNFIIRLLFEVDNLDNAYAKLSKEFDGIELGGENPLTQTCGDELKAYFDGSLKSFSVMPRFFGTEFDRTVWTGLMMIPYGVTVTYAGLAAMCHVRGNRAVGGAVGRNPVPVIVPCHRVVRSDGGVGGFSGGVGNKLILLKTEGNLLERAE